MFSISALLGTTTVIELSGLQDTVSKAYPANATVTLDVLDPTSGNGITGASGIGLALDNTTSGATTIYRGVIASSASLVAGVYPARVTIAVPGGATRVMRGTCTVRDG